jgi:GWxTD domain-containing protein
MKKWILFATLFFGLQSLWALDASVSFAKFKSPASHYVELTVFVVGSTIEFVPVAADSTQLQGSVEVIVLFKQGEEIIKFDKYRLNSPVGAGFSSFIDVKRYALEKGSYTLEVSLQDLNRENNSKTYQTDFELDYDKEGLLQSDLQLLSKIEAAQENDPFVKAGYHLEALPFNFYGRKSDLLQFYNEIYGADQAIGEDFLVSYSIERSLGSGETELVMIGHKRKKAQPIVVLLHQMDITQLPSGNYFLKVEARDRGKNLLSEQTVFFQRSNPLLRLEKESFDDVALDDEFVAQLDSAACVYSLRAMLPILSGDDVDYINLIVQEGRIEAQRMFLFSYWSQKNPNKPEVPYDEYMEVARAVDRMYRTGFGYGFESDRGYVYMKYGQPDDIITEENDPVAPPYEIWSYYDFPRTKQQNVKFIFYNPTLAGDDFRLLHSTARGELNNPQWELELYRDAPNEIDGDFIDGTQMQDNFGRQARQRVRDF